MTTAAATVQGCLRQIEELQEMIVCLQRQVDIAGRALAAQVAAATREGAIEWGRSLPEDIYLRNVNAHTIVAETAGAVMYVYFYPAHPEPVFVGPIHVYACPEVVDLMDAITEHYAATGRGDRLTREHWDPDGKHHETRGADDSE